LKCSYCGSENPDDKRFCGDCGSPLKSGATPFTSLQKGVARKIGYIFASMSILLILIGLGFKNQADGFLIHDTVLSHTLLNIAWLFGLLGVAGFFVSGLAYLLSLPMPAKKKVEVKPETTKESTEVVEGKSE